MDTYVEWFMSDMVSQLTYNINEYARRNKFKVVSTSLARNDSGVWYALVVFSE